MDINPVGGPLLPISVKINGHIQGGPAIPVYGYNADNPPVDGRSILGGPAIPVYPVGASQLKENGGQYVVAGDLHPIPVYVLDANQTEIAVVGENALPVFFVGGFDPTPK